MLVYSEIPWNWLGTATSKRTLAYFPSYLNQWVSLLYPMWFFTNKFHPDDKVRGSAILFIWQQPQWLDWSSNKKNFYNGIHRLECHQKYSGLLLLNPRFDKLNRMSPQSLKFWEKWKIHTMNQFYHLFWFLFRFAKIEKDTEIETKNVRLLVRHL